MDHWNAFNFLCMQHWHPPSTNSCIKATLLSSFLHEFHAHRSKHSPSKLPNWLNPLSAGIKSGKRKSRTEETVAHSIVKPFRMLYTPKLEDSFDNIGDWFANSAIGSLILSKCITNSYRMHRMPKFDDGVDSRFLSAANIGTELSLLFLFCRNSRIPSNGPTIFIGRTLTSCSSSVLDLLTGMQRVRKCSPDNEVVLHVFILYLFERMKWKYVYLHHLMRFLISNNCYKSAKIKLLHLTTVEKVINS